jgi:hypothetical protein
VANVKIKSAIICVTCPELAEGSADNLKFYGSKFLKNKKFTYNF